LPGRFVRVSELQYNIEGRTTSVAVERGSLCAIQSRLTTALPGGVSQSVLVTDKVVGPLYAAAVVAAARGTANLPLTVFEMESGEASKSLGMAERIYRFLADHRVGRDGIILALGGGVVTDLAGFVAATWMRGIPWIACPTTLEAQIDASIGGKTAVNIPGAKNLVGAFHHPALVLIDPDCLKTLPERDYRAGLAESVKHAAVFSPDLFAWHEQNAAAILQREPAAVAELIERNVRIKAGVVQRDPYECTGERMLLNFGHTIGHAIEECCGFSLRHGECVALGMLAAARLSHALKLLDTSSVNRLARLMEMLELPRGLDQPPEWSAVQESLHRDKKSCGGRVRWVLLRGIGQPTVRDDVPIDSVREAFQSLSVSSAT